VESLEAGRNVDRNVGRKLGSYLRVIRVSPENTALPLGTEGTNAPIIPNKDMLEHN
jgi:hypothetical protein